MDFFFFTFDLAIHDFMKHCSLCGRLHSNSTFLAEFFSWEFPTFVHLSSPTLAFTFCPTIFFYVLLLPLKFITFSLVIIVTHSVAHLFKADHMGFENRSWIWSLRREDWFSLFYQEWVACISLSRAGTLWDLPPIYICISIPVIFVKSHLVNHSFEISWVEFFCQI